MNLFEKHLRELSFDQLLNEFEAATARFHVDLMFGVVDEPLSKVVLEQTREALLYVYNADKKTHWGQGYHDGWADGQAVARGVFDEDVG